MDNNWNIIQAEYNNGATWREITKKFGINPRELSVAILRGDFISRNKSEAAIQRELSSNNSRVGKYNWDDIQKDYDSGKSCIDIQCKYGMSSNTLTKAARRGDLKTRSASDSIKLSHQLKPRKHTEKTKNKLSIIRKEYLDNNPDKIPYLLNHSSKMSYPEKVFQDALKKEKIEGWKYNLPFGRYALDFGFEDAMIDVEIDGGTHLLENIKKKDRERDKFLNANRWKVIRFTAKEVNDNVDYCIERLKKSLKRGIGATE